MASSIENLQGMIIQPLGKGGDSQWGPLGKGGLVGGVSTYMVTDGVTCAYHERGRLRPEGVKVREKCDECDV